MDKRKVRGWLMYDWANSAFATTVLAAVYPIFFQDVAASTLDINLATSYLGYANAAAVLVVALLIPVLGAVADLAGLKRRFLRIFMFVGAISTGLLWFVGTGDYLPALVLFVLGTIGFAGGNTFYDSMLSDLVPYDKRDMVSAKGYAVGYAGGGLLFVVNVLMIQKPHWFGLADVVMAIQASFVSVAVWWLLFSIPLFKSYRDRPAQQTLRLSQYASVGYGRIFQTLKKFRRYPELLKYLISYWFFNDGISTVMVMAVAYGNSIGIDATDLILALLITQIVGVPGTLVLGRIAEKLGSKNSMYISLGTYVGVIVFGYFMTSAVEFYILATVVGLVQGGSQSIARSMYSKLVPAERSAEFFSFLSVSSKFTAVLGPLLFGIVGQLTGSTRLAIISIGIFFIVGIILLRTVNMEKGRLEAEQG